MLRSVCVSSALVASSRSTIEGAFRIVLAIATRCFSPPLNRKPRSPTCVSYFSGKLRMRSCMSALRAAIMTSASGAPTRPY
uniref:Putative conserved secreted protein n=1 Tax=Anopheles darlingi TaxID=43151 RepID=A0A2M4D0D6_ANODA